MTGALHNRRSFHWLTVTLGLSVPSLFASKVRAEDHLDFKQEFYSEEKGRTQVYTGSALFEQEVYPWLALKGAVVYDAISGATPTGGLPSTNTHHIPMVEIDDVRRAFQFEPQFKWRQHQFRPQIAYSRESDYESIGISLNHAVDLNRRNTTLSWGVAHNFDQVWGGPWLRDRRRDKTTTDALIGLTQVLSPGTLWNVTLTLGTAGGYLADPYKGFRFTQVPVPNALSEEKRPGHRTKQIVSTTLTHHFEPVHGTAELTYRFYHDSQGIFGHTASLEWFQEIGTRVVLSPILRYYAQSNASFYRPSFDSDPTDTENPDQPKTPQFYSADYRLAAFRSLTYGIAITAKIHRHLRIDAAFKRYEMHGMNPATPSENYPRAYIGTVGLRVPF